jgi:hypothetical protein
MRKVMTFLRDPFERTFVASLNFRAQDSSSSLAQSVGAKRPYFSPNVTFHVRFVGNIFTARISDVGAGVYFKTLRSLLNTLATVNLCHDLAALKAFSSWQKLFKNCTLGCILGTSAMDTSQLRNATLRSWSAKLKCAFPTEGVLFTLRQYSSHSIVQNSG